MNITPSLITQNSSPINSMSNEEIPIEKPDAIWLYLNEAVWSNEIYLAGSSAGYDSWKEFIKDTYSINIILNENMEIGRFGYMYGDVDTFFNNDQLLYNGIYQISYSDVKSLVDLEKIQPIGEYLLQNESWNVIPTYLRDRTFINGQYWAIPIESNPGSNVYLRGYRSEWLQNLGIEVPKNISDLYEVGMAFTNNDPDRNNLNDTKGIFAKSIINLKDIFESFNVPLIVKEETGYQFGITYDEKSNEFVDVFYKKEMKECLEWLELCNNSNLFGDGFLCERSLDNTGFAKQFMTSNTGTINGSLLSIEINANGSDIDMDYSLALAHLKTESINQFIPLDSKCYVLGIDNDKPKETINWFLNIFYENELGYLSGRYGVPSSATSEGDFTIKGNEIIFNKQRMTPGIFVYNQFYDNYDYQAKNEMLLEPFNYIAYNALERKLFNYGIESKLLYEVPYSETVNYHDFAWSSYKEKGFSFINLVGIMTDAIINSTTGIVSIEDALENYKKQTKMIGVEEIVKDLNDFYYFSLSSN